MKESILLPVALKRMTKNKVSIVIIEQKIKVKFFFP